MSDSKPDPVSGKAYRIYIHGKKAYLCYFNPKPDQWLSMIGEIKATSHVKSGRVPIEFRILLGPEGDFFVWPHDSGEHLETQHELNYLTNAKEYGYGAYIEVVVPFAGQYAVKPVADIMFVTNSNIATGQTELAKQIRKNFEAANRNNKPITHVEKSKTLT